METEEWKRAVAQYLQSLSAAGVSVVPRASQEELEALATELAAASSAATADEVRSVSGSRPIHGVPAEGTRSAPVASGPGTVSGLGSSSPGRSSETSGSMPQGSAPLVVGAEAPGEASIAYPPALPLIERQMQLDGLAAHVSRCDRCPELAKRRHLTVFADGPADARICFFGEAPGADEDQVGRPFVGAAGQLLDKMIAACTLSRQDVYILNTLKCRPPGNRNPNDTELENCRGYWVQQLELVRPEYIVCLGAFAVKSLLGGQQSIAKLRGRMHRYRDSKVIATYHPSYLLRNESAKKLAWEDLKMLMAALGIQPPGRRS